MSSPNCEPPTTARNADPQLEAPTASSAHLIAQHAVSSHVLHPVSEPAIATSMFGGSTSGLTPQQQQPKPPPAPEPEPRPEPDFQRGQPEKVAQFNAVSQDQPITIQVGERRFTTRQSTLSLHSFFLSNMLKKEWSGNMKLPDGALFIDRDGDVFADVLTYLRTERFPLFWTESAGFDEIRYHNLLEEANYLMIEPLCEFIASRRYEKCVQIRYHTTEVAKEELAARGRVLDPEDVMGTLTAIPRFLERDVFVCPFGLTEHEDELEVCMEECGARPVPNAADPTGSKDVFRLTTVTKAKPAFTKRGLGKAPQNVRGHGRGMHPKSVVSTKGPMLRGAPPRDPIVGLSGGPSSSKIEDTKVNEIRYGPLRKRAREFVGITVLQKEFNIDHGLLMGGESSLDPENREAGYYSNLSEDYDIYSPIVSPRRYDLGEFF